MARRREMKKMNVQKTGRSLIKILAELDYRESELFCSAATLSSQAKRRRAEKVHGYRQNFALDADRILHSRAYIRYIDKTQVFSLVANDHITHRVLHVQLVSRIARTIGRFLRLNEDLIEAIALGHDLGHPPFGHDGEHYLSHICMAHGLPPFQHNIQSVRILDRLERKGEGWNLSLQTLDGILCHDGETHSHQLAPVPLGDFEQFDQKLYNKSSTPGCQLQPGTLEGCVVRLADTIGYIGKDLEDAIILKLIAREDIPKQCRETLGDTNGTIVYSLVTDLINCSNRYLEQAPSLCFSQDVSNALKRLKQFNYEKIYLNPAIKKESPLVKDCYENLFSYYLKLLRKDPGSLPNNIDLMGDISSHWKNSYSQEERVRDFIAGMTDDFFLAQASSIGCSIPGRYLPIQD